MSRPNFVVPNEGEREILTILLGTQPVENLTLKLFSNDYKPTEADTSASFTEVVTTGYAAKTLTRGAGWTVATSGGGVTTATYASQVFTFSDYGDAYGFYLLGATSGKVYVAQNFEVTDDIVPVPVPYRLTPSGSLTVPPVIPLE